MGYSTTSRGIAAASYHADISSVQSAYNAIEALDHDLAQISEERAKYGAAINNMFHAVDSMQCVRAEPQRTIPARARRLTAQPAASLGHSKRQHKHHQRN